MKRAACSRGFKCPVMDGQADALCVSPRGARGFTLIELMISLVLGLIVIGGVISVFLANQQSYRTNQALGDVQDGSRIGFEMMARDIRTAGLTGCDSGGRVSNLLNNQSTDWWANFGNALLGYGAGTAADPALTVGSAAGQQVAGTDSIMLLGAADSGLSVLKDSEPAANFKLNESTSDLVKGDVIIVCDPDHAVIVQITNYNNSNVTLVHDTGNGVATPGNCSKGLGYPADCTSTNGNQYTFGPNSQIAKLTAADWFIGNNPVGGHSLYRVGVSINANVPTPVAQEMVRDVTDMTIRYHQPPNANFVAASAVTKWSIVNAAQVTLTLESTDKRAGSNAKAVKRTFAATTTVRNRVN